MGARSFARTGGTAQRVLLQGGAHAVRVHEIDLDKRLEDVPLSSLLAREPAV
jgi:hypothetical protein